MNVWKVSTGNCTLKCRLYTRSNIFSDHAQHEGCHKKSCNIGYCQPVSNENQIPRRPSHNHGFVVFKAGSFLSPKMNRTMRAGHSLFTNCAPYFRLSAAQSIKRSYACLIHRAYARSACILRCHNATALNNVVHLLCQ